jgi:hypothetical protein
VSFEAPLLIAGRLEGVSAVPVDRDGNVYRSGVVLSPLVRIGARLGNTRPLGGLVLLRAEGEVDAVTGAWSSATPIAGAEMPNSAAIGVQLRKAMARVSLGPYLHLGGGIMTSHWGMGLVANDGAHGWEPGSAAFTDPRGGDRVLRGFLATGPLTAARLVATFAVEQVREDPVILSGDSAMQVIASAQVGEGARDGGGFFFVHRRQRAADGGALDVTVFDVAGRAAFRAGLAELTLEGEGAVITGSTAYGPTVRIPTHNVLQMGGVARAGLAFRRVGAVLDLIYASGDGNVDDARVTGFKANPNFEEGLLLFRYVLAAQSGRGVATATDPQLVATPTPGIERTPTQGAITNTLAIFPRLWVRPARGLEVYGGALFGFTPARNADPFNTQIAGGSPRNAVGEKPGSFYGAEIDLGARYRITLHHTELTVGAEGGVLRPGSALRGSTGPDSSIVGGRLMLGYRF